MPVSVTGAGPGNVLDVDPALLENLSGTITFTGENNAVIIEGPLVAHALIIHVGSGAMVRIGAGCYAGSLEIHAPRGGTITVGDGCAFNGHVRLLAHESAGIAMGRGCLVASDVVIAASDMHSVLHRHTRERLNRAEDVTIGDRVWIGFRSFVAKGASIGEGAIIGAQSVVTGSIPAHTAAAGLPARVLKHDVDWAFDLIEPPPGEQGTLAR